MSKEAKFGEACALPTSGARGGFMPDTRSVKLQAFGFVRE